MNKGFYLNIAFFSLSKLIIAKFACELTFDIKRIQVLFLVRSKKTSRNQSPILRIAGKTF